MGRGNLTCGHPRVRIAAAIARAGYTSRRKAEDLVRRGLVTVNGTLVTRPAVTVDPACDQIEVAGHPLRPEAPKVVILVYKPRGVLCTVRDPRGRRTILDLLRFPANRTELPPARLYPVGRLDYNSEGLVLLTNDGELAFQLTHPRFGCTKTYWVKVKGKPDRTLAQKLAAGVYLDGRKRVPRSVRFLRSTPRNQWVEIVLTEGRKHQVRRMFARLGYPVLKLIRVGLGPLTLGDLKPGRFRVLTEDEIARLKASLRVEAPGKEARG